MTKSAAAAEGISYEDLEPVIAALQKALVDPVVRSVLLKDAGRDNRSIRLNRRQAEALLAELLSRFYSAMH